MTIRRDTQLKGARKMDCLTHIGLAGLVGCLAIVPVTAIETNCTVRTMRGKSGQLICQFSTNIERQYNFLVRRESLDGTGTGEDVVQCWNQKPQGLYCNVRPGFEFDEKVWNMLIIDIPELSKRHEGKYVCQVIGNGDSKDNPCFYKYTGGSAAVSPSTTLASNIQNPEQKDKEAVCADHSTAVLTLLSLVLVAVLVSLAVCLLYLWKHRGVSTNGRNVNPTDEEAVVQENLPERNDAQLEQHLSKMEQEIRVIPERVYQMTTDTTATVITHLRTLSAKLDKIESQAMENCSSCDKDDTSDMAKVTQPLLR